MPFKVSLALMVLLFLIQRAQAEERLHEVPEIHITSTHEVSYLNENASNFSTVDSDELTIKPTNSLGETLKETVGVNSSSYGPTASRPVIRGLEGDRIRILQNGIGLLDASGASQDHAVPMDPLSSDRIELVRGPINLIYGTSAIGGVVNIVNSRIHSEFAPGFQGALELQGATADVSQAGSTKLDYGHSGWMMHFDGNLRRSGELRVPGDIASSIYKQNHPNDPKNTLRDILPNSGQQTQSGALGVSYVGKNGYLGVSGSTYANEYGTVAEEDVRIRMRSNRYDLAGEYRNLGFLQALRVKSAQTFYHHEELAEGVSGTQFANVGNETRLDFVQKSQGSLSGSFGIQSNLFKFSAKGSEAFLPTTQNSNFALFAHESYRLENWKFSMGARGEFSRVASESDPQFGAAQTKRFETLSLALASEFFFDSHTSTDLTLSMNQRAPNYQELFANGPHLATGAFEIGDLGLRPEKSLGLELSFKSTSAKNSSQLSVFTQRFDNYLALNSTGLTQTLAGGEVLDEYRFIQQKAEVYGVEVQTKNHIFSGDEHHFDLLFRGDYLRGLNRSLNQNLPRISPARITAGIEHRFKALTSELSLQQVFSQRDTAPNESPTSAYLQTNLGSAWELVKSDKLNVLGFFRMNNLFNVEARNHVSLLKDISMLPGRNFIMGLRGYF